MRGISPKAVLLATLAVFGIDFLSSIVLMGIFASAPFEGTDEQVRAVFAQLNQDRGFLTAAMILGTASTVLGGYIVARLAQSVPYFNALAFAVVGIVLGALMSGDLPVWFTVVGLTLSVPAALLGAHLYKRRDSTDAG
jgi:hypothetical protein